MRLHSNHRKIGRTLPLTAGVTSGLMGNVVLGNLKWGMSHHLSPSLSHYASAAHACFVCVSVWLGFFFLPTDVLRFESHLEWQQNYGLTLQHTGRVSGVAPSCVCRWFQECLCIWEVPSGLVAVDIHAGRICCCNTGTNTRTHTHTCTRAHTHTPQGWDCPTVSLLGTMFRYSRQRSQGILTFLSHCLLHCAFCESQPPHLSLSLSLRHTHTHTHSLTEHQTYYPLSHSALEHSKMRHTSKQALATSGYCTLDNVWKINRFSDPINVTSLPIRRYSRCSRCQAPPQTRLMAYTCAYVCLCPAYSYWLGVYSCQRHREGWALS